MIVIRPLAVERLATVFGNGFLSVRYYHDLDITLQVAANMMRGDISTSDNAYFEGHKTFNLSRGNNNFETVFTGVPHQAYTIRNLIERHDIGDAGFAVHMPILQKLEHS